MFIANQATITQRRACNLIPTLDSWLINLSTISSVTRYTITWTIPWAASSFSLSILQGLPTCWRTSPKSDRYLINPAERPSVSLPSRQRWTQCLVESTTIEPVPWAVHLFFLFLPKVVALQHQCVATSWPVRLSRVSVSLSSRRWWISLYFYSTCYWGSLRKRRVQQSGIVTVPEYDVIASTGLTIVEIG